MPGKKGVKLIARMSKTGKWNSVKELVFALLEKNPNIRRQEVEKEVLKEYPNSNFVSKDGKRSHFPWYKHNFSKMKLEEARFNLKDGKAKEEEVNNDSAASSIPNDATDPATAIPVVGLEPISAKLSKGKKRAISRKAKAPANKHAVAGRSVSRSTKRI